MIYPLFDKNSNLVTWVKDNEHIFDTNMQWVAFIEKGHAWSAKDARWLGQFKDNNCMDKQGRVFAWNNRQTLRGSIRLTEPSRPTLATRPCTPTRPSTPTRPMVPIRPLHGWSPYSLREWLAQ